jgi:homoserine kinase
MLGLMKFVAFPTLFAEFEPRMSSSTSESTPGGGDQSEVAARVTAGMRIQARVRVPGTTSNLGPGFDCLGCGLSLWNEISLWPAENKVPGEIHGNPFFRQAAELFFAETGLPPFDFECGITGDVPRSRGLGSSATVRVGIMAALGALYGVEPDRELLFRLCTMLEGHPDNAAPTVYGGFHACQDYLPPLRFEVDPELKWVLLIPDFEVLTAEARQVLPDHLDRLAAARTVAGACRITGAFATQNYELLRGAFEDELHQPFRKQLVPGMHEAIAAAENAGALGGFLSGSGSTLIALTLEKEDAVADAMLEAFQGGAGTRTLIVTADNQGIQMLEMPAESLDSGIMTTP